MALLIDFNPLFPAVISKREIFGLKAKEGLFVDLQPKMISAEQLEQLNWKNFLESIVRKMLRSLMLVHIGNFHCTCHG